MVDRHWGIVSANRAFGLLIEGAAPALLEPPENVLRLALRPDGVAPRIVDFAQLRTALLLWLGRQAVSTGDPALAALYEELIELLGGKPSPDEMAVDEGWRSRSASARAIGCSRSSARSPPSEWRQTSPWPSSRSSPSTPPTPRRRTRYVHSPGRNPGSRHDSIDERSQLLAAFSARDRGRTSHWPSADTLTAAYGHS